MRALLALPTLILTAAIAYTVVSLTGDKNARGGKAVLLILVAGTYTLVLARLLKVWYTSPLRTIELLAFIVPGVLLSLGAGILIGGRMAPPIRRENWAKSYQTLISGTVAATVASLAAGVAWTGGQRQIGNSQALADAAQRSAQHQTEQDRKRRRLEYLRQYVPQLQLAASWLRHVSVSSMLINDLVKRENPICHSRHGIY